MKQTSKILPDIIAKLIAKAPDLVWAYGATTYSQIFATIIESPVSIRVTVIKRDYSSLLSWNKIEYGLTIDGYKWTDPSIKQIWDQVEAQHEQQIANKLQ
jgi:hypothetical protein